MIILLDFECSSIFFFQTIIVVRNVIRKFHQSHLGISELTLALEYCKITRGLEAIGRTRFGTVIRGAQSVSSSRPAITRVVERDNFDLGVSYCFVNKFKLNVTVFLTLLGT
jgi:hypothetical protein